MQIAFEEELAAEAPADQVDRMGAANLAQITGITASACGSRSTNRRPATLSSTG